MISKMTKFSFILLSGESEAFLQKLQGLGLVDITRSSKSIDSHSAELLDRVQMLRKSISILENLDYSKDPDYSEICAEAEKIQIEGCRRKRIFDALSRLNELKAEDAAQRKLLRELSPWGEFDLKSLGEKGLKFHFFCVPSKKFDPEWEEQYPLEVVSEEEGKTRFVVVSQLGEEVTLPVPELPEPEYSASEVSGKISEIRSETLSCKGELLKEKQTQMDFIRGKLAQKSSELDRYLASTKADEAVEGAVVCFEGFAPTENKAELEKQFDELDLVYLSEDATEQDNPPIKLRNNKYSKLFECLTGMYGMPVYGEWDPTPVLSIFFLLFFALCMGDAGYGLILILYGILQDKKIVNIGMFDGLGKLIAVLGCATTVVGFFLGTFFGIDLTAASWVPEALKSVMIQGSITVGGSSYAMQMVLALAIGVFHICLAMTIKTVLYTKRFGFKKSISNWGWLILILGGIITAVLAMVGFLPENVTKILVIAIGAVSALGIFIFNKPGRNPLINIGAGLWDTYNMVTGLLGDVLSYVRLYALGLAGGMLGGAFNNLGGMVLGTDPTWQWLPFVLILLVGHVLNLLMSCLGAFVHPLRLTFVEYFKNSGYEGKGRKYNPLKNNNK